MKRCFRYEISGLVQGVGFRPFVYILALRFNLFGEVYNDDEGVKLALFGELENIEKFEKALFAELPNLARIDEFKKRISNEKFDKFSIIVSKSATKQAPILPDFALCSDCEREFYDPNDPRYHYAFINCTNCGPRFSIIKSLPYDRKNTTMDKFNMCEFCGSEYADPLNRRYHAQPVSCPNCGPMLFLKDMNGKILNIQNEAVKMAAELINSGNILAIKGLGGFHLVCSAQDESVINRLRIRKNRLKKPFAIMCKNLHNAKKYAEISTAEERLLTSNLKPIVILNSRQNSPLPPNLAPNLDKIGIFLPYTGIHLLLFEWLECDIIATSANISGEPIIYNDSDLRQKLDGVVDYYLDNDREIYSPNDDSIVYLLGSKPVFLRTSRGVNPKFIHTNFKKQGTFLAVGAELKNQFAIYKDGEVMISPYIGDLKNIATFERFDSLIRMFECTYELKFDAIIADLHPHFLNLKWAKDKIEQNSLKWVKTDHQSSSSKSLLSFRKLCLNPKFKNINLIQVQHHYAHLLSVIFENELDSSKEYLGFCFDGTGYGTDGTIWGGEVMIVNSKNYERIYHFDEFLLIGGESSIKNIWQIAYSIILKYGLKSVATEFLAKFDDKKLINLKTIYNHQLNCVTTSSLGRIFDAFGSIVLGIDSVSYEGEVGMELEALYDKNIKKSYKFEIFENKILFKDAFIGAFKDDKVTAASAFINGICDIIIQIATTQSREILLSGGVFQNKILVEKIINKFKQNSVKYYLNKDFPTNDSSVAIGQLMFVINLIKE
ncbi:carbamoyltransferase HypF [Campylobacter sp. faydin G-24]|uniref:Carbamoyltransferase n=1 Tax=Campylobacter anatolicus TaxID=2829105 RepID=A0ABS5HIM0_9BACT|nr:carbamoyltransferase HypF [Campylobacter anatolicus]MBR8463978.1 carbamoyltransferase HypF [Campylobacter anatolicus]